MQRRIVLPSPRPALDAWDTHEPQAWINMMTNDERFRRRYISVLFDALDAKLPKLRQTFRHLQPLSGMFRAADWMDLAALITEKVKLDNDAEMVLVGSIRAIAATELDYAKFCIALFYLDQLRRSYLSAHEAVHARVRRGQWLEQVNCIGGSTSRGRPQNQQSVVHAIAGFFAGH